MSRGEFFEYHKYFKHNIQKVWTSYNSFWQDKIPSNEGFLPLDSTGSPIDVITEIDLVASSGIQFKTLESTENLVTVNAGNGRSHAHSRSITMFFEPNDIHLKLNTLTINVAGHQIDKYPHRDDAHNANFYTESGLNLTGIPRIHDSLTPAHEFGHMIGLAD